VLSVLIASWVLVLTLTGLTMYWIGWYRGALRKPLIPKRPKRSSDTSVPTAPSAVSGIDEAQRQQIDEDLAREYPALTAVQRKRAIAEIQAAVRQMGGRPRLD
jgi:hypothetical protein